MCRRPRRSKISADPHKLHDVGAADALEVADVDVAVDGDDRHHGEIGVQGVVELAGAGAAAALVGGRAELAGLSIGEHSHGDRVGVIGQSLDLFAVDGDGVLECQLFHVYLLSINRGRRPEAAPFWLQDAADVLGVVDAADAHDGVELVDQPVFVASDEKLVAADGQRDLVLAGVAGIHVQAGDALGDAAEERLAAFGLGGAVGELDVLRPADLDGLAGQLDEAAQAEVDADLGDGCLHRLDLAEQRRRVGSHRFEVSRHKVDGRQGDGHVLGGENAVHIDGIGEDGALQVEPQVCHYSSPPS